ncbi:GIY-YIG nuclease family protein [Candidatus Magnetaquicoccus inordinatus]|uniref:GIY-YIG nuclease family protein n=1 Tax=Candidatus Magnetaquicoccus inordinatus TaxID=2496818 RepID=UPI001D0E1FFD|nr:GIY-YIG nuclease family protein [Candidatus Magnetaquicoccus inordinatus]
MTKPIEEILAPKPQARPRIYAYSIADPAHKGLLKVGQTTRDVKQRVAEQLKTAAIVNYRIELDESAERDDGGIFSDHEVRAYLKQKGFDNPSLEPACGSGNFLVPVLRRKLLAVELRYGQSDFEKRHYALLGLMCIYGIELLSDNIAECRANLLGIFAEYLGLNEEDNLYRIACFVLSLNIVHGDALTMKASDGQPITFAEWGYLGKGKFQRRDFLLDILTLSSTFSAEGSLFAHLGKHEIFTPIKVWQPMIMSELAVLSVQEDA